MTENVSPEMVERMIALVRRMASLPIDIECGPDGYADLTEARAIAAELPAPVDPDLIVARTIARTVMTDGDWSGRFEQEILAGAHDDSAAVRAALAALKSRTLATQGDR